MDHTYFAESSNLPRTKNYKSHRRCSVPQCDNRACEDRNISLHRFPGDINVMFKWLGLFKLETLPRYPYACSEHFCSNDFISPEKRKKRLKLQAIPSQKLPVYSARALKIQAQKENREEWNRRKQQFYQKILPRPTEKSVSIPNVVVLKAKSASPLKEAAPPPALKEAAPLITRKENVPVQVEAVVPRLLTGDRPNILNLIQSDADMQICTNLTIRQFQTICEMVNCFVRQIPIIRPEELSISSKILLTLMKLKENHSFSHLSFLFDVTAVCCSSVFFKMIGILRQVLGKFISWPSKEEIRRHLPKQFSNWPHTRVVIDCIEIEVSSSRCLKCSNSFCSHFKQKPIIKFLVGMAPTGPVTFLTDVYDGETPAKTILDECGLLNLCEPGDRIIANRGFLMDEPCQVTEKAASQPPTLRKTFQLSDAETVHVKPIVASSKPTNIRCAAANTPPLPGNTRFVVTNTKDFSENTKPVPRNITPAATNTKRPPENTGSSAAGTKPVSMNTKLAVANTQPGTRPKVHIKTVERIRAYGIINSPITSEIFNVIDLITNVVCALVNFTTPSFQNE